MFAEPIKQLAVPIGRLEPHPANPRRGEVATIKESLRRHGQYRPVVVNRRSMQVLAGNHTLRAAAELGWSELAATFVDADEDEARRILLADNRTSDLAGYDPAALADLLTALPDLDGTGYDEAALSELLEEVSPAELPGPEEEVPPAPACPTSRPGDLYRLGAHRLLCADATDPSAYARLLAGQAAELLWTDPPYGVAYTGKTRRRLTIAGDDAEGIEALLSGAFAAADPCLLAGAPLYIAHPGGPLSVTFAERLLAQGWQLRQTLVWVKDRFSLGRSCFHYRHEPILYGFKPGEGRLGRGGRGWYGGHGEDSVFEYPRPRAAREHPTMKPPALVGACLSVSSPRAARVLDPFAGSGSTLVACEALGRRAQLMELDPAYCDVIVRRYEQLTGRSAEREPA